MEAYLDNAATTRVSEAVLEKMNQVFRIDFGNPSSMHKKGMEAEQYIKEAKKQIVKFDKKRAAYYNFYTDKVWGDGATYDLCINSSAISSQAVAELIVDFAKKKLGL